MARGSVKVARHSCHQCKSTDPSLHLYTPYTYLTLRLTLSTECMVVYLAHLAMYQLVNKGVTVVVAAGNNNGDAKEISPARCEAAITVGAANIRDARADFSNYGTVVDIFAPGENITSAGIENDTAIRVSNGTSMVRPFAISLISSLGIHGMPSFRPLLMWLDWRRISLLGEAKMSSLPKSRQCSLILGLVASYQTYVSVILTYCLTS